MRKQSEHLEGKTDGEWRKGSSTESQLHQQNIGNSKHFYVVKNHLLFKTLVIGIT